MGWEAQQRCQWLIVGACGLMNVGFHKDESYRQMGTTGICRCYNSSQCHGRHSTLPGAHLSRLMGAGKAADSSDATL
jgi:hypothetical protein